MYVRRASGAIPINGQPTLPNAISLSLSTPFLIQQRFETQLLNRRCGRSFRTYGTLKSLENPIQTLALRPSNDSYLQLHLLLDLAFKISVMDPLSILCSILTIMDASKKVSNTCTYYFAHAKHAPKELQTVIEDIHALNGTMTKLDGLVKSTRRTQLNEGKFDQWELHLTRIAKYAKELERLVSSLDMEVGFFHELGFRARWARGWQAIKSLLDRIRTEKGDIHLATSVIGA